MATPPATKKGPKTGQKTTFLVQSWRDFANSFASSLTRLAAWRCAFLAKFLVWGFSLASVTGKAICLLSGGLDSTTCLALARQQGLACYALSFDYGQRHRHELVAAAAVARQLGALDHKVAQIDLRAFGGSALTDNLDVPKHDSVTELGAGIPITYVPARNTIFLSFALAYAEVTGAKHIFIGVNAVDYSGYPDCRPEYIAAYAAMANLATKAGVEETERLQIHTPLITMSKAEIIHAGLQAGADFSLTHSCYDPGPDGRPCLHCDSCLLRAKGFADAGRPDPLLARFGL